LGPGGGAGVEDRTMRTAIFVFITGIVAFFAAGLDAHSAELKSVRFGPEPAKTRIVFDIAGAPDYTLSGDETGNGRLFVDFKKISIPSSALAVQPAAGHVANYQFIAQNGGAMRAVLTFKKTAKIAEHFIIEPSAKVKNHRLVIDLAAGDMAAFMDSIPAQYPDLASVIEEATTPGVTEATPPAPQVAPPPPPKRVIVVDAGHGGRDPGAIGSGGTYEKTVTMAAALQLKEVLEKTGRYDVVLTRESDKDPRMKRRQAEELARRETLARDANAALFISLHADALADKDVRGASVYTLSDKGTERATKLAKSEGNYTVYQLDTREFENEAFVGDMLFDIATDKTNSASSRFAQNLLDALSGKTKMLNRSHRKADLRVLLAPDVPAVLLEMAYMSNAKDEANLKSKAWRAKIMAAVADAIDAYFEDNPQQYAQTGGAGGN